MATENYLRTGIVNKPTDLSYLQTSGLLLAYNFVPSGQSIPDISGSQNAGLMEGSISTTPLGIQFDSIQDASNPGAYVPKDGDIFVGYLGLVQTVLMNIKWKHAGNTASSAIFQASTDQYAYFDLNAPMMSGPVSCRILTNGFENLTINPESSWNTLAFVFDTPIEASDFYLAFSESGQVYGNYEIRDLQVWDRALTDEEIQNYTDAFGEIIVYADFSAESDGTSVPKDFVVTGGLFNVQTQHGNQNRPYLENKDKYVRCAVGPGYIGAPISDPYSEFEVLVYKEFDSDIFDWHVWSENVGALDLDLYRAPGAFYGKENGINIRWESDGTFKFYFVENHASQYNPGQQVGNSHEVFAAGQWLKLKLVVGKSGRFMLYVNDTLIDNLGVGQPQSPAYMSFVVPTDGAIAKIKVVNADFVTKDTLVDVIQEFSVAGNASVTATISISQWGYAGYTAQSWELYRSSNGTSNWTKIATVSLPTLTYLDNTTGGAAFYYKARLKAGNMYGGFSRISRAGSTILATPYGFSAIGNGDEGRILFRWNNNGVTDMDFIEPQLSTDGVVWNTIDTLAAGISQYQAMHQGSTKKYHARVKITRGVEEVLSTTMLVITAPAMKPPGLGANQISPTEVQIMWSPSGVFGPGEGYEAWRVFRSTDNITFTEIYYTSDLNVLSFIDTSPLPHQWYQVAGDDGRLYVYAFDEVEVTLV